MNLKWLWDTVRRQVRGWSARAGRRRLVWITVAAAATLAGTAWGLSGWLVQPALLPNGYAQIPLQVNGTVWAVDGGRVELREARKQPPATPEEGTIALPVPPGRWISPTHWQSDGGTLDLFRGEQVTYLIESKQFIPVSSLHFYSCEVLRVDDTRLVCAVYADSTPYWTTRLGEATLRLAPYSRRTKDSKRPIRPGDHLSVGWFGDAEDQIVWQFSVR